MPDGTPRPRENTHREQRQRAGLRPVKVWVPDVTSPEFAAEARRQCALVATSPHEADDQAFIDAVSADPRGEG